MSDNKGDTINKQPSQQQQVSTSPPDQLDQESSELPRHHHQQPPLTVVVSGGSPFISTPLYVPTSSPFECFNPKRPRFTGGQWKTLPSVSPPAQKQQKHAQMVVMAGESSLSPTTTTQHPSNPPQPHSTAGSSSDTAASLPPHGGGQETTTKPPEVEQVHHHQYRKGKYVSPVWKPHEMLWLAKAWRVQYQGGGNSDHPGGGSSSKTEHPDQGGEVVAVHSLRGKSRAEKDREVAEFLNKHGVNRDAKTAGTKWDNMLGEFRKVYEWERGTERDHVGKSYFRLSPYERKIHRLPASFDEEVFEELSQFMGPRMRTSHSSRTSSVVIASGDHDVIRSSLAITRALPTKEDDPSLSGRTRQLMITSLGGEQVTFQGNRSIPAGLLGFETSFDVAGLPSSSSSSRDVRRIGKIRMTWEESVSLWAEEGEHSRGRVRLEGSNFLNADELTFLDDAMVACTMEAFEDGPLKGFSVDRFICGQQVKVFGRKKSSSFAASSEKVQLPITESSIRSFHSWEFQDPSEYYVGCLRTPPPSGLPGLLELSWHLQEPPPEELRFPLRKDVFMDLPQGKEIFFTTSAEPLDCRSFTYDILGPIIRTNSSISPVAAGSRECYVPLWDDCINRVVLKFCSQEFVLVRKPSSSSADTLQDSWPNVTGFVRNLCLWRGEETDQIRDNQLDPSSTIVEKLLWTYNDLPYILGYYAIGHIVTFCALSRSPDRVIRTDLYSLDLSSPAERLKALVPCYRIASLLPLLADRCLSNVNTSYNMIPPYSDFERIDMGHGNIMEMTPNTVIRHFTSKKKWSAVKGIYDCLLDHAIPHVEFIYSSSNQDLALVFKPRGCKTRPLNVDQLVEALMYVTKALVALHDVSFMHRDLSWDKVMRRTDRDREAEWFICGFEEAASAPQIHPCMAAVATATTDQERVRHAPEMTRGLHGAKVDVWGIGHLIKTCGLITSLPKILRELQNKCLEQNPEQRPTAADCYHHLLQLQSSATL